MTGHTPWSEIKAKHHHVAPEADVGVIVGRFQVADLHDGHRQLIDTVTQGHRKVVILLGVAPVTNTRNNPLDFEARKQMIQAAYPNVIVLYVKDVHNDYLWSSSVDRVLADVVSPSQSVLLYGSRDSFISAYCGKHATVELPNEFPHSGSYFREIIGQEAKDSSLWRAGVIWASRNRHPIVYPTVDVAIFRPGYKELLLGRKLNEHKWRFIGGFSDPTGDGFDDDARREAKEEAGVTLQNVTLLRTFLQDDWRYRSEVDCIKTILFSATTEDDAVAGDDIKKVQWFPLDRLDPTHEPVVMPVHSRLATTALMWAMLASSQ